MDRTCLIVSVGVCNGAIFDGLLSFVDACEAGLELICVVYESIDDF